MAGLEQTVQIWGTFALVVVALVLYALERAPMEVISLGVLCALMSLFHFFPLIDAAGVNRLAPVRLLHGFANPALITVLALLVIAQGMVRAGVLDLLAGRVFELAGGRQWALIALILTLVTIASGFLNNTPVVVMFIPVFQALATRLNRPASKLMIPLTYAAVLGGMTTLVGSSTNLLVNSALIELQVPAFRFFEFTVPGLVLAGLGLVYVLVIAPRLLPSRTSVVDTYLGGGEKQFISQFRVAAESPLVGKGAPGGLFAALRDVTVRLVQRNEEAILPPFEGFAIRAGDVLVVAATRKALTEMLAGNLGLAPPEGVSGNGRSATGRGKSTLDELEYSRGESSQVVAEVMVAPASRLQGQTLRMVGFHHQTHCIVLGIQRRSRMIRTRMTDIRLEAGDVLLVQGRAADVHALRLSRDVVLMGWSAEEVPTPAHARPAAAVFVVTIALAASGLVPLVAAALAGATVMVASGLLTLRQAMRAIDTRIIATIGTALALSVAMQETGGAVAIATALVDLLMAAGPTAVLSVFFLLAAALTNVISNNAVAVLFTPIAVDTALQLGVAPHAFAVAVVFGANCSFASPIGYQTNLLVMGPGNYRFLDFARAGIPLIILLWIAFTLFVPWWYGF